VDAHDPSKRHAPIILTTDLALKEDPTYEKIARHFYENPDELKDAFAKAWFKLIHRDMGPKTRYLGPLVPDESFIWQDPVPTPCYRVVSR
jgi:catalase-peroxidase